MKETTIKGTFVIHNREIGYRLDRYPWNGQYNLQLKCDEEPIFNGKHRYNQRSETMPEIIEVIRQKATIPGFKKGEQTTLF